MASRDPDPYQGFRFRVSVPDVSGRAEVGFSRVSGLREETEVIEYREGDDPTTMRKLPGLTSFDNIVLERGIDSNSLLLAWRKMVVDLEKSGPDGAADVAASDLRREVVITLQSRDGRPVREWTLNEAWPTSLEIGELDASTGDVILETVEIAHEGLSTKVL